jgi:hypothetical protein
LRIFVCKPRGAPIVVDAGRSEIYSLPNVRAVSERELRLWGSFFVMGDYIRQMTIVRKSRTLELVANCMLTSKSLPNRSDISK